MANKQDSGTRSDLVRLVGVRFISTSETESNQRLAESLIKQWTGGEQISTRDLYGKTFEFYPQGKIFLATNHKPRIHSREQAMWRRVRLIPFTRTFEDGQKDPDLLNKLKAELPGILNWALQGYKEWQEHDLQTPASVLASVESYREDMDAIGAWLQERCEQDKSSEELISNLFEDYKKWAADAEEFLFNKRLFVQQMEERGFQKVQTTLRRFDGVKEKGRFLKGLRLVREEQMQSLRKFEKPTPKPRNK